MASPPSEVPWRSTRGRSAPWTQPECRTIAEAMLSNIPAASASLILENKKKVDRVISYNAAYNVTVQALKENFGYLKAVIEHCPQGAPSSYMLADAFLELDKLLNSKLLNPAGIKTKQVLALEEAGRLRKMVGHTRNLHGRVDTSRDPVLMQLKSMRAPSPGSKRAQLQRGSSSESQAASPVGELFTPVKKQEIDYAAETDRLLGIGPVDAVSAMGMKIMAMDSEGSLRAPNPHQQWALAKPEKNSSEKAPPKKKKKNKSSFGRKRKAAPEPKPVAAVAMAPELLPPPPPAQDPKVEEAISKMLTNYPEHGPRESLHLRIPVEAWPKVINGKHSYTIYGGAHAKVEVNLKCKHFRVQGKEPGTPPIDGSPNVPWAKYSSIAEAWTACKVLSGFDASK
ncbi:unnamed protein product [Prorocentrum cordatum]|uniref:Uncharacterized protein n=1 Tax=Prorocentrum cordatum TaxID=2364126 RepID=A0ABN9Q9F7_9DINO|nr:unnamed protein product [Polarella glacialis]